MGYFDYSSKVIIQNGFEKRKLITYVTASQDGWSTADRAVAQLLCGHLHSAFFCVDFMLTLAARWLQQTERSNTDTSPSRGRKGLILYHRTFLPVMDHIYNDGSLVIGLRNSYHLVTLYHYSNICGDADITKPTTLPAV